MMCYTVLYKHHGGARFKAAQRHLVIKPFSVTADIYNNDYVNQSS